MERRRFLSLIALAAATLVGSMVLVTPKASFARPAPPAQYAPCYGVKVVQPPAQPAPKRPSKPRSK